MSGRLWRGSVPSLTGGVFMTGELAYGQCSSVGGSIQTPGDFRQTYVSCFRRRVDDDNHYVRLPYSGDCPMSRLCPNILLTCTRGRFSAIFLPRMHSQLYQPLASLREKNIV